MAKIGGMFFEEGVAPEDIEFSFDKFVNEIVDNEEKAKAKKAEAKTIEKTDQQKRNARYLDRPRNRIRYGRKK